ncbi:MAG: hypothetical protein JXM69_02895 [Anaerolineae bacterium]|nr:hypothetical protein [Anaerolineae bacterium]
MNKSYLSLFGRFLAKVVLIVLVVFVAVSLVCWFFGWRTSQDYGNGLFLAGLLVMVIGGISFLGIMNRFGDPKYSYFQSVASRRDFANRTRFMWGEFLESYSFILLTASVGMVLLVISFLIAIVFPGA